MVCGTTSVKVLERRREEMPREAGLKPPKNALGKECKRLALSRWGSTVTRVLDEGLRPSPGVLSDAKERRLGSREAATRENRRMPIR
jgi:hypothetical protein